MVDIKDQKLRIRKQMLNGKESLKEKQCVIRYASWCAIRNLEWWEEETLVAFDAFYQSRMDQKTLDFHKEHINQVIKKRKVDKPKKK